MSSPVDNRWRAILGMSSDHAGINQKLGGFRAELYRVLARIDDAREVREYLAYLGCASRDWLIAYDQVKGRK